MQSGGLKESDTSVPTTASAAAWTTVEPLQTRSTQPGASNSSGMQQQFQHPYSSFDTHGQQMSSSSIMAESGAVFGREGWSSRGATASGPRSSAAFGSTSSSAGKPTVGLEEQDLVFGAEPRE